MFNLNETAVLGTKSDICEYVDLLGCKNEITILRCITEEKQHLIKRCTLCREQVSSNVN